jgi:hypothetical protein
MSDFSVSEKYINKRCGLHKRSAQKQNPNKTEEHLGIINNKGNFTACSLHQHLTDEEYDEIIPQIIDEFVNAGFEGVFNRFSNNINTSKETLQKNYLKLKKESMENTQLTAQKTNNSNKIIKYFQELNLLSVRNYRNESIETKWSRENLIRAFKSLDKPHATVNSYLTEITKAIFRPCVTVYSPIMTKTIIQALDCKTVFDPCIGWGGRMLGSVCNSYEEIKYKYTGCEPNVKTYQKLKELESFVLETDKNVKKDDIEIINKPVESVISSPEFENRVFDCCLTSPPYFDLEIYSDEDSQSINTFSTYESWLDNFIEPIIKYVTEHVTKYSCWSVKNIKTNKTHSIADDVEKIHNKYGWKRKSVDSTHSIIKNVISNKKTDFKSDGDVTYIFVNPKFKE